MYKRNDKSDFIILNGIVISDEAGPISYQTNHIYNAHTMLLLGLSIVPNILLTGRFFFFGSEEEILHG